MSNSRGIKPGTSSKKSVAEQKKSNKEQLNMEEALSKSESFILKYKNAIIIAVVAILVIVAGILLYTKYVAEPKSQEAAEAIFPAQNYFDNQDFETALNGDSLGNMGFIEIADEYSSTPSGNLANAYAGIALVNLKRYEEAVKYLKAFDSDDIMIAPAVMGALATCYTQAGELDKAAKEFKAAAQKADNNSLSPYYLLQAGLIYEQQGQKSDALSVYQQIKDSYPNSLQAMDVDKYIERVK